MSGERSSWSSLTTLQKVALVLGIPASGAILYILYRRYRESQEERLTFVGEEEITIDMKVPKEAVKLLIGRHGANIKQPKMLVNLLKQRVCPGNKIGI